MSFTVQNLDTREGIPGLVIGTLVGQQGDVFTPFFNFNGAIILEGNQLKLGPDYFFDFETKDLLSATFSTNQDGIVSREESVGCLRADILPLTPSKLAQDPAGFLPNGFGPVNVILRYEETLPNGSRHLIQERSDNDSFDNTAVYQVPDGHYFMMGDNRDNSRDSRTTSVGIVPAENMVGRAERLFFSHNGNARLWEIWKWPFAIRYGRIGDGII